ncbi:hypothetical protein [Bradyrhizobium semiaridum]|uniref:hypothetical protein n=1 Tax=Bradyrhizobium semiaridum TaxID=2821404 RepID=UPI0028976BAB|nr:hypothetical protein [Bradyrhizobium semiaridum]
MVVEKGHGVSSFDWSVVDNTIQNCAKRNAKPRLRVAVIRIRITQVQHMDPHVRQWKLAIERFCEARDPDYGQMARMVAEIAATDVDETLRQAAAQVLPILRQAAAKSADRRTRAMALRRLGLISDALHMLAAPRFGRRGLMPRGVTQEDQYRQLLGLPLNRHLAPVGDPPGVQARRQDGASRRRRQRRRVPRACRGARCADEASLKHDPENCETVLPRDKREAGKAGALPASRSPMSNAAQNVQVPLLSRPVFSANAASKVGSSTLTTEKFAGHGVVGMP